MDQVALQPAATLDDTDVAEEIRLERFEFRGSGSEYFRIWIVNLFLSILTLGIFSAWAKVRRLRYFYGNTYVAGSSFGYHANPVAILKGRILASILFVAYAFGGEISLWISGGAAALFALALPWIVVRSRIFQLRMTSFRNIRFDFERNYRGALKLFYGVGLLVVLTFGLMFPRWQARRYEFLVNNSRYGSTRFATSVSLNRFYVIYLLAGLMSTVIGIALIALIAVGMQLFGDSSDTAAAQAGQMTMITWAVIIAVYLFLVPLFMGVSSYTQARVLNHVYDNTKLGPHGMRSELRAATLWRIYLGNIFFILITLGLYVPWARVRLARYRAEALSLVVTGSLDEFVAAEGAEGDAAGQEVGELFDVDFGL